jgi:hypothetical protein
MGWHPSNDDGSHEGYLVGFVEDERHGAFTGHCPHRLRELGTGLDHKLEPEPGVGSVVLRFVKVGCACGWRSPLLHAPSNTEWFPCIVAAPADFEDACAGLWQAHVFETGPAPDGGCSIRTLLARAAPLDPRAPESTLRPPVCPRCGLAALDGSQLERRNAPSTKSRSRRPTNSF